MRAHWAYFKYVVIHKWFVFRFGWGLTVPLWRLIVHDWTKFLPCEWFAYVNSFYNKDGTKKNWKARTEKEKLYFDWAWNHHQKVNKHHWQYWVLTTDSDEPRNRPLDVPTVFIREMVADWAAAGRAITGKVEVVQWYLKNKDKMLLSTGTRIMVEGLLARHFNNDRCIYA